MLRHLITSEYPPQSGGVSDYTRLVSMALAAAGDEVHVWCPRVTSSEHDPTANELIDRGMVAPVSVSVHRELGNFTSADLRRAGKLLDQYPKPRLLLIQWVPHGYGYRSMNLPFCLWLWHRAKLKHDRIELMVHEPFLAFGEGSLKQQMAATVHRLMIGVLLNAAGRVWVSISEWETLLRPLASGRTNSFTWLPVPSNIPVIDDPDGVARVRAQYALPGAPLAGHFGACNQYMVELMSRLLPELLTSQPQLIMLLAGNGSLDLRDRVVEQHSDLARRIHATGRLSAENLSRHISACDVMLQPYQDGVSGRRTSVMTALSHGIPVVTTIGKATEACWVEGGAVKLTEVGDTSAMVAAANGLLADARERCRQGAAAMVLYHERFDVKQTISALREVVA